MNLYKILAETQIKTHGSSDGEFVTGGQTGTILLHGCKLHAPKLKQTVILVGEILTSVGKDDLVKVQPPGTKVKFMYSLTDPKWGEKNLEFLKRDLCAIMGISNPKDLTEAQQEELFSDTFEGEAGPDGKRPGRGLENSVLRGVVVGFSAFQKEGKGFTTVRFSALPDENTQEKVMDRRSRMK